MGGFGDLYAFKASLKISTNILVFPELAAKTLDVHF